MIIKKENLINKKASISYLQIFILLASTFAFSFLLSESFLVSAQAADYCCEKTNYGAWCQNAPEEKCQAGFRKAPTSCDATPYCKGGCCYDSSEGLCMENTPQRVCNDKNGTWNANEECDIPQCELGCCVLDTQAAYVTLTRCKKLSGFYGLETDFRQNIGSELECIAVAQAKDKGACVYEEEFMRTCKFTTREECNNIQSSGNMSEAEFYADYLCSAEELATNCGPSTETTCIDGKDEVYFKDTCGNPANIYDASKINDKSYWKKIINKAESCGYGNQKGNAGSKSCGNCDYYLGSLCKKAERNERATYGNYICKDLNCYETSDGDKRHGESWCSYDGNVGQGKDAVGSRHVRNICVAGEELVEPCEDFRQKVCLESETNTGAGIFKEAACRVNRWQDVGGKGCVSQDEKDDCENTDKRDCFWIEGVSFTKTKEANTEQSGGVTGLVYGGKGACLPNYPPGLKFWEEGEAESICKLASAQCVVLYEKGLFGSKKCVENCECLEEAWAGKMNQVCSALGDCGAYVNWVGKYTDDGAEWKIGKEKKTLSQAIASSIKSQAGIKFTGKTIERGGEASGVNAFVVVIAKGISWVIGGGVVSGANGEGSIQTARGEEAPVNSAKSLSATPTPPKAEIVSEQVAPQLVRPSPEIKGIIYGGEKYIIGGKTDTRIELTKVSDGTPFTLPANTNLGDYETFAPTSIQEKFMKDFVTINGNKYTLSHVIEDNTLRQQLINNPKLLEGTPYKTATMTDGKLILSDGKTSFTYNPADNTLTAREPGSTLSGLLPAKWWGTWLDGALSGLQWGAMMYGIGQFIGSFVGMDKQQTKAISTALFAGTFTWQFLSKTKEWGALEGIFGKEGTLSFLTEHPFLTGLGVAIVTFVLLYKKESQEIVTFSCLPWQAPVGGGDCEKCNLKEGCSEYRCKSLGQACQLLNAGSKEERCAWVNPKDAKSPGISPWEQVLTAGYKYTDVRIRPPGEGVEPGKMRIVKEGSKDGCVEAFTPLEFGIVTMGPDNVAEPAQCKIDYNHTLKFDDMAFYFGESNLFRYNHSQRLSLPGPSAVNAAAPEIQDDGTYTLYVRCRDANGNENVDEFAIRFCVDKGPDTTPPKIEGTSIGNGMPVKFNQSNVELEVYVNEPSECKWSREDRSYSNMEQEMTCSKNVWEMNNNLVYTCKTILTGIKNRQDNVFYFRCKDQPWQNESSRNTMQESYKFTLTGTEPLNIIDVKPNGTIKGSTDVVSVWLGVETANGYKNGEAICYYSASGNENDFIEFFDTGTSLHKQRLDLVAGSYKYYIKCVDLGGNRDDSSTEFKVEVDRTAPFVARVYRENELLKIITTEKSECRYDIKSCNFKFEDGIDMPYANQTSHVAEWKTENTYYIRCSDEYGNIPLSNQCSIIVRPYDVVEQKVKE